MCAWNINEAASKKTKTAQARPIRANGLGLEMIRTCRLACKQMRQKRVVSGLTQRSSQTNSTDHRLQALAMSSFKLGRSEQKSGLEWLGGLTALAWRAQTEKAQLMDALHW